MKKRNISLLFMIIASLLIVTACSNDAKNEKTENKKEPIRILVAAAASMESSLNEIIDIFEEEYNWITVEVTYDSSGKLQTQIEEGLGADVFLSAAMKQMNALKEQELIDPDSVIELLENKLVLIIPVVGEGGVRGFNSILDAETIAIGDPASVPAGQYAEEIFKNMNIYDDVLGKASLGTNVTQVLNWVSEGSADAGIVYSTDAALADGVRVIEEAPEGTLDTKVIYPTGIVSSSENKEEAKLFIEYLQTENGAMVFEAFGFSLAN